MVNQFKQFKKFLAITIFAIVFVSQAGIASAAISTSSLVDLTNNSRTKEGLNILATNSQLESAARAKADDMFKNQYFAHTSPSGKTPWTFIKSASYTYAYAGENLAIGYSDMAELHNAWTNSPSHRENIMNPNFREIGMASVDGVFDGSQTTIVVQMFGSKTATAPVASQTAQTNQSSAKVSINNGSFSPNQIFSGEVVALKADVSGETQKFIL